MNGYHRPLGVSVGLWLCLGITLVSCANTNSAVGRRGTPYPTVPPPSIGSPTSTLSALPETPSPTVPCYPSCAAPTSTPANVPGATPTSTPAIPDDCFKNHNGSDGHGYIRAHLTNYAALLSNDANEIATDQSYLQSHLSDCSNHQASFVRVYGSYPSGGDPSTALAVANKVIAPVLQNLGATRFIFVNTSYAATTESDPYGSYDFPDIEIIWRY